MKINKILLWCVLPALFSMGMAKSPHPRRLKKAKAVQTATRPKIPVIHYNEKGQLYGELPQLLFSDQSLQFYVSGGKDPMDGFKKSLTDQAARAKKNIAKIENDVTKMFILQNVYGITADDLNNVLKAYDAIIKNPFDGTAFVPHLDAKDGYYKVSMSPSAANPVSFNYNATTGTVPCAVSDMGRNLTIDLSLNNLYKEAAFNWLSTTKAYVTPIPAESTDLWQTLKSEEMVMIKNIQSLIAKDNSPTKTDIRNVAAITDNNTRNAKLKAFIKTDSAYLELIIKQQTALQPLLDKIKSKIDLKVNKNWLLSWLWYQKVPIPAFNPFNFVKDESLGQEPDTSGNPAMRLEIQTRENYIKNSDTKTITPELLDKYIGEIDKNRKKIAENLKAQKNYEALQANNESYKNDFAQTSTKLNESIFFLSGRVAGEGVYWMRHHNAADRNQLMSVEQSSEYLESDRVVIVTHNLTSNESALVNLNYTDIKVANSILADDFLAAEHGLTGLTFSTTAAGGNSLNGDLVQIAHSLQNAKDQLLDSLKKLQLYDQCLDYLLKQNNPETELKENPDMAPVYHSEKLQTPAMAGNKAAVYTITTSTSAASDAAAKVPATNAKSNTDLPVDTFKYRVNKQYRIFPMAGLAYTINKFSDVAASTDGASPGKVTSEAQVRLIAGLKFFIKKTDIRNTQFFTQRDALGNPLFWTRAHIDVAVGVTSPLNNIYTGAGIDLFPGLDVNFGIVFNKYNYNTYTGGQNTVSQPLYRAGVYVGLSTDVAVVAELIKLLNIGK